MNGIPPNMVYTHLQAKFEAMRCLMCEDSPCACDCPAGVDPRAFIRKVRFDNMKGAVMAIRRANVLAGSCAYICPTGEQCAKACTSKGLSIPIDIAGLQKFVMEWERRNGMVEPLASRRDGKKIAVIGSGPTGLSCAAELAVRGHIVTIFDKAGVVGGMLSQCIPHFRLPPEVVAFDVEFVKKLGVEFILERAVDEPKKLFSEGFDAVFIATGLHSPVKGELMNAEREGIYQALDLLRRANRQELPPLGQRVVVIGGGDTALDAARVAKRQGCEAFVLYRRTQAEMPAYKNEIEDAWHDGVEFYFRTIVRSVVGEDRVKGVRCVRVRWREKVPGMPHGYDIEGAEFTVACDAVVLAIGQGVESSFGLRMTPNGVIAIDKDTMMTSEKGIFAGGDAVVGGRTASQAVGMGKLAAMKIGEYVSKI